MSKDLVTVDEYKEFAGIYSSEFDDKLQGIVKRVSQFVKTYCGRNFIDSYDKVTQEFVDLVTYSNSPGYVFTQEFPILSLQSVEVSTDLGTTYEPFDKAVLDRSKDAIFIDGAYENVNAYKITYKGGFTKTPEDLKLACLDLVEYYYKGESVPRKTSGNVVVEYQMSSNLPAHIKRVLDLYRVLE